MDQISEKITAISGQVVRFVDSDSGAAEVEECDEEVRQGDGAEHDPGGTQGFAPVAAVPATPIVALSPSRLSSTAAHFVFTHSPSKSQQTSNKKRLVTTNY